VVGDPVGVGDVPLGMAGGLTVCDGWGGRGEVRVGAGAVGEGLVADWVEPSDAALGTGRTRM
jgi:hypothetical protein